MGDVAITAPDPTTGRMMPATVPEADLAAALAAGAKQAPKQGAYEKEFGGALGQAASAAFGAGRMVSGGAMDGLLIEGANIAGGESARADMLHGLRVAKETNPYATLGGEAAGLLIPGAGKGLSAAGAGLESAVAGGIGEGLLGKVAGMGARGVLEGGALGAQHEISEQTLGDVGFNGEKVFAAAGKDALLGGGIGAGFGVVSHFGSEALGAFRARRGPQPAALLDDVAGVEGAGQGLRDEARASEGLVSDFQKAGATSEQGAVLADEAKALAKAKAAGDSALGGFIDARAQQLAKLRAGGNADLEEVFMKGYEANASTLAHQEGNLDNIARKLADKGTQVMRNMEDVVNDAQFTQKAGNMAKLTDPSKWEAARDTATKALQDTDAVLSGLEQTASKGGQEGAVRNLRKQLTDFYTANERIAEGMTGQATENATRDFFMRMDALKRSVDKFAGHGTSAFGRTEASHEFRALADRLRSSLEDEAVWGPAGAAQRETNATFSLAKGRRDDFGRRFAVSVDQVSGVPVPELDAGKIKAVLRQLEGAEGDQAVKTTEAFIDGLRARTDAVERHFSLDAGQASKLAKGKASLDEFATTFAESRKEASVISRLRAQQLEEHGHGLGGVLGLAQSIMSKPLQQMERLGALKAATERFEKSISNGIGRFFEGKGSKLKTPELDAGKVKSALRQLDPEGESRAAPRAKTVVANEIGDLREVAANPAMMQSRVGKMLGDIGSFAPNIHGSAATVAMRALTYLASEAPAPRADQQMLATKPLLRFSDQQIHVYETKRNAAFHPETVVADMQAGKLNRDGIQTVKVVYPQMFAMMQDTARTQLIAMEQKGLLDKMPYAQKAAIATLLEVPPDGTWTPDFMALMQSTKAPRPAAASAPAPGEGVSKRAIKMDTKVFETEAQQVEGRTNT